jgi:hypothetical protein
LQYQDRRTHLLRVKRHALLERIRCAVQQSHNHKRRTDMVPGTFELRVFSKRAYF